MQLQRLLQALPLGPENSSSEQIPESEIGSLAYDSRKVEPGSLFIAVPGTHTDGRRFLSEAAQRGAVAAIGEALPENQRAPLPYIAVHDVRQTLAEVANTFYGHPSHELCTIGITGTDGKTTTSNLISTLLETAGIASGMMTTANFKIRDHEWENATRQSTLEAVEIQQFLRQLCSEGVTHAIVESTSHGLELKRVYGCEFDIGVVTNITHEHLDFHKTLENYRRAKARLFEMLDANREKTVPRRPVAILNRDDVSYEILKPYCQVPILDYGIETAATVRAVDLDLQATHSRFRVLLPDAECTVETHLVGRFNVSNCLAALATVYSQGISLDKIVEGLSQIQGVTGRMERIDEGQSFTVIVDYAHTPDSLGKVLDTLRPVTTGKLLVVFGSAGERDLQKRPIMGQIAAQKADFFVLTDEDPREEDREKILREIAGGAEQMGRREGTDFLCIADRSEAIALTFQRAQPGDTILLAGKGHEQSMIIGREKHPWDDRRIAREHLQKQA